MVEGSWFALPQPPPCLPAGEKRSLAVRPRAYLGGLIIGGVAFQLQGIVMQPELSELILSSHHAARSAVVLKSA